MWTYTNRSNGWLIGKSETFSNYLFPVSEINTDFKDIRESVSLLSSQYIWKYVGLERGVNNPRTQQTMEGNFIIYRLAEIYLMKAEALTQLGIQNQNREQLEHALAVLQVIRTRANATETTDLIGEDENFTGEILEQFILWERAREFTFEGKRWFDVLRHAKRNNYVNPDYLIELAARSAPADKVRSLQTKYQNINSHYFRFRKAK
ncbi:MAG: RagB/SusD family nutrient uptake outer membrane protein [Bacteroides sp.]|nr:RagB/SusD family nutrient uptake outer membrane protein [Bacteroides sp.]